MLLREDGGGGRGGMGGRWTDFDSIVFIMVDLWGEG